MPDKFVSQRVVATKPAIIEWFNATKQDCHPAIELILKFLSAASAYPFHQEAMLTISINGKLL